MNCSICGKKIVLVPSAEERAHKTGKLAAYYRSLFTEHAECAIAERETLELIARLKK